MSLWIRAITMMVTGAAMHQDVDGDRKKRLQEGVSKKFMDDYASRARRRREEAKDLAKKKRLTSPDLEM